MDDYLYTDNMKIVLSQADMAKAVKFWLNNKVLSTPCEVINLVESRTNQVSTFEVVLAEPVDEEQ